MSSIAFNWSAFLGALIVAAATAVFAFYRYMQEQRHQRETLLNSLFAELANIYEHYSYAAFELPLIPENRFEVQKRLRWSAYGDIESTEDIEKLGFLDAVNIKALLQLGLLIRNDNLLLKQLLENEADITQDRLQYLRERFLMRVKNAERIIGELISSYPRLNPVFDKIKSTLP